MAGTIDKNLSRALKTRENRKKLYGDAHIRHGDVMKALLPNGIALVTAHDFARFGALNMIINKLCRYTANEHKGHPDSAHDLIVYGAMLEERT